MKYGIEYDELNIKCANCGNVVSQNGELEGNYCDKCGTPLSANRDPPLT